MSKHFGGGGGRRMEKDYPPPPSRRMEDKRPSVFDRLGVRKYEDNLPSSSHSHSHYHGGGGGDGGPYRRNDGPSGIRKHSPMQSPMMGGRRSQENRDRIRSRSRSRSFSPRSRKMPPEVPHHQHHHGHMGGHGPLKKASKMKEIPPHDHRMRQESNSPTMRRKPEKLHVGSGNSPKWREEGSAPVPRHHKSTSGKPKKGFGKKAGKKSSKDKKAAVVKGRSSSATSGTSGETSSSSRSASSSSTTSEASSSSSTNASSSSDSSVPSIKLRHDKQKRKKPKRPSSKSESVSTGQIQSRISSGSSIDSGNLRDNRDLREKIKAKTRQNYERMQDGTPQDLRQQRRPPPPPDQYSGRNYNKQDIREESPAVGNRRRRPSGSSSYEDKSLKRRRLLSPEEFSPSPRRAPPNNDPPSGVGVHQIRRGERSPLARDRIRVIQSPMRRAPAEDTRRGDVRSDLAKRLDNFGDKARDTDRFRDEGSYGRDNRQKERLAPARTNPMRQAPHPHPGQQMTPHDRDRERGVMDRSGGGNSRYEPSRHNRPLLLLPPGVTADQQKAPMPPYKSNQEERVMRTAIQSPTTPPKHTPMIVKSKEALIEKYREMKQSQYVDMWVDKTVEACAPPGSNIVSPPKDVPSTTTKTLNDSAEAGTKASSIKDIEDMLSDFSDDADELLNEDGTEQKSEKSVKDNSSSVADKDKINVECETEVASIATTETNTQVVEKKPSNIPTPVSVLSSSQDRKSVSTPQRSFLEVNREGQSLPSRSQTEDDILERMDFEEISDEELGDVSGENKIPIVDALGVDWASLVCGEKNRPVSPSSVLSVAPTSQMKVRKRWTPLQVISRVGVIKNCSERLLQKIVDMKMKEEPYSESIASGEDQMELEEKIQDEMQNAGKFRKMRARTNVIDTIGLGPNSRALSSRRDMALRRYYLGMPQKSLVSMDMLHQNPASAAVQDLESIGELYRLSLSLFKGSESAAAVV